MSTVFISYSRRDNLPSNPFVTNLFDEIERRKIDAWMDKKDIPPSFDFWKEIVANIDNSDYFLFVISPDSVTSEYCLAELRHAVDNGKILIPVVRREADKESIPPSLSALNWIMLRESDNLDENFLQIIQAIESGDQNYVHRHTRLLVRAREWESKQFHRSFLLRGSELKDAVTWLKNDPPKKPFITELHQKFISDSIKYSTRQFRLGIAIAFAAIVIVLTLAIFSANEASISEQERIQRATAQEVALTQEQIATSRRIAAQALTLLDDKSLDVSLLLAAEATHFANTVQARSALLSALQYRPRLVTRLPNPIGDTITETSISGFSPNSSLVAVWYSSNLVITDLESLTQLRIIHTDTFRAEQIAFSRDNKTIWLVGCVTDNVYCQQPEIRSWSIATGNVINMPIHLPESSVVAFSSDSTLMAVSNGQCIDVWDMLIYQYVTCLSTQKINVTAHIEVLAFVNERKSVIAYFSLNAKEGITVTWDIPTGDSVIISNKFVYTSWIAYPVYSPDGTKMLNNFTSQEVDDSVILTDLTVENEKTAPLITASGVFNGAVFSPDSSFFATVSCSGIVKVFDVKTGEPIGLPVSGARTERCAVGGGSALDLKISPNGKWLITAGLLGFTFPEKTSALLWNIEMPENVGITIPNHLSDVHHISISHDSRWLALAKSDEIVFWDLTLQQKSGKSIENLRFAVSCMAFSPNGEILAIGEPSGTIELWNLTSHKKVGTMIWDSKEITSLAFSANGELLASLDDVGNVVLWTVEKPATLASFRASNASGIGHLVFTPDSKTLFASAGGGVDWWDIGTLSQLPTLNIIGEGVPQTYAAISSDGSKIAATGDLVSTAIYLWSVSPSGVEQFGQPMQSHHIMESMMFSSDNQLLVSSDSSGNIILWDVINGSPIGAPFAVNQFVQAFGERRFSSIARNGQLSPDGKFIISMNTDGTITIFDISVESLQAKVCTIVRRNLTLDEWHQYVGEIVYHPTCPEFPSAVNKPSTN